jgi:hypothetical protein
VIHEWFCQIFSENVDRYSLERKIDGVLISMLDIRSRKMKNYNEEFMFEGEVLHVRLSGNFPNKLLRKKENPFQPLIDTCLTYKFEKALVDARDLQVSFDTFHMYGVGKNAVTLKREHLRVALLAREDMIDPFFETVISNRGGNIGVFTDKQAALDWLEK